MEEKKLKGTSVPKIYVDKLQKLILDPKEKWKLLKKEDFCTYKGSTNVSTRKEKWGKSTKKLANLCVWT